MTVTGPGGAGKTRLAGQVARQVAGRFADGAWLVELAPVQDPAQVAAVVAAALGVREQPGIPAAEAVARVLARQQLLLVLDNCEHVIGAAAELCAGLLAACDDVRVLATSREPLAVAGEARYRLGPLTLPGPGETGDGGGSEAVALFADRARSADAHFTLDEQAAAGVARLVARLDGMPLAIELAAARVEALGVGQLLDRLDDRFALLAGGDRLAPSRQRSLAATVEWSYQLLDEAGAAGVPGGVGVPGRVHAGGRRGGRRAGRRAGGAAAGGLLAAGPAAGRPGWPVPVLDAGDAARLRGPAAGRGRGAGRGRRRAGRVRAGGGRAGRGGAADQHGRGAGRRALAGRRGRHHAAGAGLGDGPRPRRWRCGWRSRWAGGGSCGAGWRASTRCCASWPGTPSRAATGGAPRSSGSAWAAVFSADLAGALEHFTALRDAVADRRPSRALADALAGRA